MRTKMGFLILGLALLSTHQAICTILPDSCGDDKVKFEVSRQKGAPAPAAADPDKARIVFIEWIDKSGSCIGCQITTRVGLNGAWVGANQGNSYFTLDVAPGEQHVCTDWQSRFGRLKSKIGLTSFPAEAGKTYYYKIKVTLKQIGDYTDYDLDLMPVSEDEGKYRMKASALSKSTPRS